MLTHVSPPYANLDVVLVKYDADHFVFQVLPRAGVRVECFELNLAIELSPAFQLHRVVAGRLQLLR